METTLLDQGLSLMLVGMGTVFTFLTILVLAMLLMSFVIVRLSPAAADTVPDDEEIAAITAAITQHRRKSGGGVV